MAQLARQVMDSRYLTLRLTLKWLLYTFDVLIFSWAAWNELKSDLVWVLGTKFTEPFRTIVCIAAVTLFSLATVYLFTKKLSIAFERETNAFHCTQLPGNTCQTYEARHGKISSNYPKRKFSSSYGCALNRKNAQIFPVVLDNNTQAKSSQRSIMNSTSTKRSHSYPRAITTSKSLSRSFDGRNNFFRNSCSKYSIRIAPSVDAQLLSWGFVSIDSLFGKSWKHPRFLTISAPGKEHVRRLSVSFPTVYGYQDFSIMRLARLLKSGGKYSSFSITFRPSPGYSLQLFAKLEVPTRADRSTTKALLILGSCTLKKDARMLQGREGWVFPSDVKPLGHQSSLPPYSLYPVSGLKAICMQDMVHNSVIISNIRDREIRVSKHFVASEQKLCFLEYNSTSLISNKEHEKENQFDAQNGPLANESSADIVEVKNDAETYSTGHIPTRALSIVAVTAFVAIRIASRFIR